MADEAPLQQRAAEDEGVRLLQAENNYLKQRVVDLNVRVRTLTAEVRRLTPDDEDTTAEED